MSSCEQTYYLRILINQRIPFLCLLTSFIEFLTINSPYDESMMYFFIFLYNIIGSFYQIQGFLSNLDSIKELGGVFPSPKFYLVSFALKEWVLKSESIPVREKDLP